MLSVAYVDDSATGLNNGTSWADAYTSLQAALTAAVAGQEIRVGQGTYKPTAGGDRTARFALKSGVSILGGYAGFGAPAPDTRNSALYTTCLSGDIGAAGSAADNSYHVVVGSNTNSTAVLDGFTITGGNANGSSSNAYGGGMYVTSGSPTLTNCTFTANSANWGGGMYNYNYSLPTLTNCTFTANSTSSNGGGMLNASSSPTLTNCTFTANSASSGGGMLNSSSSPTLTNCAFTANSAGSDGGGMYNSSSSSPKLTNCAFTANSATRDGGGMYNASSSATLTNCTLIANSASNGGGGMYNASSSATLTNCTLIANSASIGGGMTNSSSSPTLTNCIVWATTGYSQIYTSSGTPVVTYSDIQDGYSGAGNIDLDPQFVRNPSPGADGAWRTADDDYGDLRLRLISPCIDAGKNSAVPAGTTADLAGNPRFVDVPAKADTGSGTAPLVDMGAYEAPVAVQAIAGGPYQVVEELSTMLAGAGYSPTGLAVSYAWDFDGDGQFDDATSAAPVFSATGMQGPQTLVIALRVTDTSGATAVDTAVLRVAHPDYYVDQRAPGLNNGTSWADAYTSLQSALARAVPGQVIEVAQGTYKPTTGGDRTATFALRSGIGIYGGFAGYGAMDPAARDVALYPSILSGDIGTAGSTADNSYHVVVASGANSAAVLDGCTITGGSADGSSSNAYGGGMLNYASSLTLANCTFIGNWAGWGGGMYNSSSSATLINCTFIGNSAGYGGGMYNPSPSATLINCTFTANSASRDGGGMYNSSSSPTLTNCTFAANSASYDGGAVYNRWSSPTLINCTFTANSASSFGGGGMHNYSSSPTLTNCTFTGNSADYGGGMDNTSYSSPTLTNCTFSANSATWGGGMSNGDSSSAKLTNCTFSANSAGRSGGGMSNSSSYPTLKNSILWGNMAPSFSQIDPDITTPLVSYSDIQGGYSGTGNKNVDPQFVRNPGPGPDGTWGTDDDDYGDLRLRAFSPAVDAGNNSAVPSGIASDLAGNRRFADVPTVADTGVGQAPIVDLGAYEAVPELDADAGGPYAVLEGSQVTLHGHGASGQPGALVYEWDFNADGQYDDAVGPDPTFWASAIAGPRVLTVGLRVTDAALESVSDTAVVIVAGAVAYVDDTAGGADNGTSWADAFRDLQSALAVSAPGQTIRVAQGTYKPTSGTGRGASFVLRSGVALYGGYAGYGAAAPFARDVAQYVSTLSGDIGTPGDPADNSYHVVVGGGADATGVLDGFTIIGGNANGNAAYSYDRGGGMYNDSSSPTLANCTFTGNSSSGGGGMYNNSSSPTLTNCTFTANSARDGGGMYNNSSSPTLTNCTFTANSASSGGGMKNDSSSPTLANCKFTANLANDYGGAMYNKYFFSTLTNCTFTANSAGSYGGGLYDFASSPTLTNCILWANTAPSGSQIYTSTGTPVVTYSDIQGGDNGTGNINLDPQFVRNPSPGADGTWGTADDDYGDLRLLPSSPCIDAGKNSAVPAGITADLAGNPRFADVPSVADTGSGTAPIVDMGAYESPNPNLVVAGTDGPDQFLLSLFPDQASIQIVAPGKSSTYSVLAITAITVNGGEGDDRLTVDFTNGSPVPSGGVTFDGQGGSDCVRVVTPGNNATLTGEHVSVGTAAPIGFSNTEGTSFDLGTGRLTKNGSGTAVLVASSSYAGGTEVLGGALVVGHANALPVGGSLTIGPGAAVVLPSGVIQAAVGIPGNAAFPAPAGCGEWQVDCLLSTVYCLPSTVHSLPSTVHGPRSTVHMPPRFWADTSLAVACDTLIPSPATRASPASDHRSESGTGHGMVQSAEVQGCQQLAGWAVSGTSVKKKAPPPKAVDQVLAALWPPKRVGDHEANRGRRANHAADRPAGRR